MDLGISSLKDSGNQGVMTTQVTSLDFNVKFMSDIIMSFTERGSSS